MIPPGGSRRETWDEAAPDYDRHRDDDPVYRSCLEMAVRAAAGRRGGGIALDAGCGTGMATLRLLPHFEAVVAADYSLESLRILRGKASGRRALRCVWSDLQHLPFPSESFDAVLCANALQHLAPGAPQSRAATELVRVAKREATVVVTVHHYSREKRRLGWIKEGKPGQAGIDYIYRFEPNELEALFPGARIDALGFPRLGRVPKVSGLLQRLASRRAGGLAARLGLGHMLMACLVKA